MKNFLLSTIALSFLLLSVSSFADDWAITANNIENLSGDLNSVSPAVLTPSNAADYLDSDSALGYDGPLGPYGPLGILGPVGDNSWNSSYWINLAYSWTSWETDNVNGPLSEQGPLGPYGPLSELAYDVDLPAINDFGKQLQGGGVWTTLGPLGPLGALGPLGPLGPIGAHGYSTDLDGRYIDNSVEVREVNIDYNGGVRTYELFENYPESYAETSTDNDTSFMVEGWVSYPYTETDSFEFTSGDNNYLTIVLTPVYSLDDFDLVIKDELGNVVATSNTYDYIDFVQLNNIAAGTKLTAEVTLYSSYHYLTKDYRLFVVGSTEYVDTDTPITGSHQLLR
ncbi:MAG: hypothetical protein K6L76_04670 [Agarilytica sp.]